MKVFVTGATGFVGHHVARALAAEGADLRLLVRRSSNLANLEGIAGETHVGDLADPDSLRPALAGCDAVMHVAADYRLWIRDPAAMYKANVDGTRELLRMAREAGVPRVVYTSSVATMHFRTDGLVINEDTPVSLKDMVGHYKRSKFLAEQEAIKAAQGGQKVMILNPTTPIGPNDAKPTPTGRIFVDFLNGKFPAYMDTGLNLVDVAEVARSIAAMFETRIHTRGGRVRVLAEGKHWAKIPADDLRQMLTNLVGNACDALPAMHGVVEIQVTTGASVVRTVVRDNGAGIREENVGRIFEPFFTTKADVGTGIGLWVTKELAEKHRGRIGVHIEPGYEWSTEFWVVIPMATVDAV